MSERANPDTCEHRILQLVPFEDPEDHEAVADAISVCVNCDSTISPEWIAEYSWTYDIDYNVWRRLTKEEVEYERRLAIEGFTRLVDEIDSSDEGHIIISDSGVERSQARTDPGD